MAELSYRRILGIGEIQTRGSKLTKLYFPLVINSNRIQTIPLQNLFSQAFHDRHLSCVYNFQRPEYGFASMHLMCLKVHPVDPTFRSYNS